MNYAKIYNSLIERGLSRVATDQYEIHHIVPRCLGGTDAATNLVKLTPEEHYVAHQLLVKMHPDNKSLIKAAQMMIPNRPSNKLYGWVRRKFAAAQAEAQSGEKNSQYGTKWINNSVDEKKVPRSEPVPTGWELGRKLKPKKVRISRRQQKKLLDKAAYKEYYRQYKELGWESFVTQTGYEYSQQNFVMRCSKLLEDFEPQNGRQRGK